MTEPQPSWDELARENAKLKELLGGPGQWAMGASLLNRRRTEWEGREARRWLNAQGWQAPPAPQSLATELARPRETFAYRIPGLAGWNHNVLLAGPRKAGKTQLAANLNAGLSLSSLTIDWAAVAAATAWDNGDDGELPPWQWRPGPFLGLSQCFMAGNAAYLNAEMDAEDWRDVFRALPAGTYDASRIYPLHCRGTPLPVVTSQAARAWFVSWLRERDIEVLTIDTWGALCAKNGVRNLNDDAEARVVTDCLDEIKQAAGVACLIVLIHMPHQTGERHLERFKGAGAVGDWADALWSYVPDDEGTRYLSATGRARIDHPEAALFFDRATGMLCWGMTGSRAQTAASRAEARILEAVHSAGAEGMLTEPLLDAAGGHRPAARELLRRMVAEGRLHVETEGRAKRYRYPTTQVQGE
jgi:hypothetical protein